jgi:hypothetical protein
VRLVAIAAFVVLAIEAMFIDDVWVLGARAGAMVLGLLSGQWIDLWWSRRSGATTAERSGARTSVLVGVGVASMALGAQLSLGYGSPILGLGAAGLLMHLLLPDERSWPLDVVPAVLASALVVFGMVRMNLDNPYRDVGRAQQTHDLGDVFVKLSGIRTSPQNHARYAALKASVEKNIFPLGRPFVALQDYPGINWLFGTQNPISIDWCYPPEPDGFEPRILAELERTDPVAIVPKLKHAPWWPPLTEQRPCREVDFGEHNAISRAVVAGWRLVAEDDYFCLYRRAN